MGAGMSATSRATTDPAARFGAAAASWAALLGLVVAALVAGCSLVDAGRSGVAGSSASTGDSQTEPDPAARVQLQAREALERWEAAVDASGGASITFIGPLTSQLGAWRAADSGRKEALASGLIESSVTLSHVPAKGEVTWLDGDKVDVDLVSAAAALEAIVADGTGACAGCTPVVVTDAVLATDLAETQDGPAEVPHWVFSIEGSDVRVTRIAVDGSITLDPPPWNAGNPPVGRSIEGAVVGEDDSTLRVSFTGAAEPGDGPCGVDYTVEAMESELAVVIVILEDPAPAPASCPAFGVTRTATVTLAKDLGDRAVLEVRQGLPVPVIPAPS
jgi:hypothetical protein